MTEDFFKQGKQMTDEEIAASLSKDSSPGKGSYALETQRLRKAISDHLMEWAEKAINRFLDSAPGQDFLEKHQGKSWQEAFEIFKHDTNFVDGAARELQKIIDKLRGKIG